MRNKGTPRNRAGRLSRKETLALVKKVQNSEEDSYYALQKLMFFYLMYVRRFARRYVNEHHSIYELIEEGYKGLIHAIKNYNEKRYPNFFYYAIWWIEGSIKQFALN